MENIEQEKQQNDPEEQGLFRPIEGDKTEYLVVKRTLSKYEAVKKLAVESGNYTDSQKEEICKEMGWKPEKVKKNLYGFRDNQIKLCEIIFEGFKYNAKLDLDLGAVERAYSYFLFITR